MLKSEYDRKYLWHSDEDKTQLGLQKITNEARYSEPRMTHKRRVKLTEDNVVIGEPLPHQSILDENKTLMLKNENLKQYKKKESLNDKLNKDRRTKRRLINEFVQTDDRLYDKSTQISKSVPDIPKQYSQQKNYSEENQARNKNVDEWKKKNELRVNNEYLDNAAKESDIYQNGYRTRSPGYKKSQNDKFISPVKVKEKQNIKFKPINNTDNDKNVLLKSSKENYLPIPAKSEYQTKYAWQDPVEDHGSQSARNPHMISSWDSKLKIYNNFISEYQRQYRPYEFVTENKYKKMKPTSDSLYIDEKVNFKFIPEKYERRRAITPPPRVNLNKKSYKVEETINPQRMSFPHGKQKRFLTEYSANYDNKWDKLDAEMQRNIEEKAREANSEAKWFQEILELRKKAQEYRQRSRGTHFSREHLGQVYSRPKNGTEENNSDSEVEEKHFVPYNRTNRKNKFNSTTQSTCSSYVHNDSIHSSSHSTIIGKPKSRNISPIPRPKTAGKPTNDNNLLLDEEASHDTAVKSPERPYCFEAYMDYNAQNHRRADNKTSCPINNERKYTLEKYLNMNKEDAKRMKTIDYESVSKCSSNGHASTRSMISSSTMSLALETLERAKRNRDEVMRQKS